MKTFKEYVQRGYSIGPVSTIKPMASLGDVPPKNKGHRNRRAMGLVSSVLRGKAKEHIPIGIGGVPDNISDLTAALCSSIGNYINGQTITVDGGLLTRFPVPDMEQN